MDTAAMIKRREAKHDTINIAGTSCESLSKRRRSEKIGRRSIPSADQSRDTNQDRIWERARTADASSPLVRMMRRFDFSGTEHWREASVSFAKRKRAWLNPRAIASATYAAATRPISAAV